MTKYSNLLYKMVHLPKSNPKTMLGFGEMRSREKAQFHSIFQWT